MDEHNALPPVVSNKTISQQLPQVIPPHLWAKNRTLTPIYSKPSFSIEFIKNTSLSNLIFDSLDGFFFVVNFNGIIKFASENVVNYIKYSQVSNSNENSIALIVLF